MLADQGKRLLLWLVVTAVIVGCAPSSRHTAAPVSSPGPSKEFRKLGPELRRQLLQQGRPALETPELLNQQLHPITVVIRAHRDISEELESQGATVHSVTQNGAVVITADVPPAAIPSLLTLPELQAIELTQPVPPANGERRREKEGWRGRRGRGNMED